MVEHLLAKEKVASSNLVFRSAAGPAIGVRFLRSDAASAEMAEWQTLQS